MRKVTLKNITLYFKIGLNSKTVVFIDLEFPEFIPACVLVSNSSEKSGITLSLVRPALESCSSLFLIFWFVK